MIRIRLVTPKCISVQRQQEHSFIIYHSVSYETYDATFCSNTISSQGCYQCENFLHGGNTFRKILWSSSLSINSPSSQDFSGSLPWPQESATKGHEEPILCCSPRTVRSPNRCFSLAFFTKFLFILVCISHLRVTFPGYSITWIVPQNPSKIGSPVSCFVT